MKQEITLQYYSTELGLLIKLEVSDSRRINSKQLKETFHKEWCLVPSETEILTFERKLPDIAINRRYELKNQESPLEKTLLIENIEKDQYGNWTGRHLGLSDAYQYTCEYKDAGFEAVPFVAKLLGSMTYANLGDPTAFKYTLHQQGWDEGPSKIDYQSLFSDYSWSDSINVDGIVKALIPTIAWHLQPCSLSSLTSYRIIRSYIKDNLDGKYAEVTSDYDFCFTVKKKVRLEPWTKKWEVTKDSGKSYRPPRYRTRIVDHELHEVFEMTQDKDKYSKYTVIEGFKGESLQSLMTNIDTYLKELIEVINYPLVKCPSCNGTSVVGLEKIPTNLRKKLGCEPTHQPL